jgi:nicotinamidase-related amidase
MAIVTSNDADPVEERHRSSRRVLNQDSSMLIVIDAQRAFVDPAGSLARACGLDEVRPGADTLSRLQAFLTMRSGDARIVLVRSEYRPGQFTGGQLDHPLADLCVPGRNIDCEWALGLDVSRASTIVTKHHADAGETPAYREAIARAVAEGTRWIAFAGFQFTTCVKASALATARLAAGRGVQVAVVESLTGARAGSYRPTQAGLSRVEMARRELQDAGVAVVGELNHIDR